MKSFDTIIIGAGLAGCTLGKLLLSQNKSVLIIEREEVDKKSKLCGGILTNKSLMLLSKIYGPKINDLSFKKYIKFKVGNNGSVLDFENSTLHTIFRKELDDFVINEFKLNGGTILDKTIYEKIYYTQKLVYVNKEVYQYNYLVAADGVFSQVRSDLTRRKMRMNFALETYINKSNLPLKIDFIDDFKGYAWVIPNNDNTILGLGDVSNNTNIKEKFIIYFNLNENHKIKGAFLPTGDDILLERNGVYFIGDAAGLISPITGEGIYYALVSAEILSKSISDNYKKNMKKVLRNIKKQCFIKRYVYRNSIRNYLFKKYCESKVIKKILNKFVNRIL